METRQQYRLFAFRFPESSNLQKYDKNKGLVNIIKGMKRKLFEPEVALALVSYDSLQVEILKNFLASRNIYLE